MFNCRAYYTIKEYQPFTFQNGLERDTDESSRNKKSFVWQSVTALGI